MDVPFLEVSGPAYKIGKTVGRTFPNQLRSLVGAKLRSLSDGRDDSAACLAECRTRMLSWCQRLAPDLIELMHGYADGADVCFDDVVILNCCDEIRSHQQARSKEACTSFAATAEFTGGMPLSGQSKDGPGINLKHYVVLLVRQEGRPAVLQLAYPGMVALLGLSETGMCIFTNQIYDSIATDGINAMVLKHLAWSADHVDDVEALVAEHGTAIAGNFLFCDRYNGAMCLELQGQDYARCNPEQGLMLHTNHYLCPRLRGREDESAIGAFRSRERFERLRQLLQRQRGRLKLEHVLACYRDHEGFPRGICTHDTQQSDYRTTAVVIAEPTQRKLHIVAGYACENDVVTYHL
jgi:isopenicillin-N N-acyltransferase-like protein